MSKKTHLKKWLVIIAFLLAIQYAAEPHAWAGSVIGWGVQKIPPDLKNLVSVAGGGYHSVALMSNGSIVGWGFNYYGQAESPAGNDFIAIAAGGDHNLALRSDGSIVGWGRNDYGQANPPEGNDFVAIAAGFLHSLALKADGSIVSWGRNNYGQADPPEGNDFIAIAAGWHHNLVLRSDGSIVNWGRNNYGQAEPPTGNDFIAIVAGNRHSLALRSDGSIVGWGNDNFNQADPPEGNDFIAIAAGGDHNEDHSLALKRALQPIEVLMKFTPQALNPVSQGRWVKAHFVLPEGFGIEDVDVNTPTKVWPFGIESNYINIFINEDSLVELEIGFDRADFCSGGDYGPAEITVVGRLTSGQYFVGSDTIRIITNNLKYLAVLSSYWLVADCGAPDWCSGVDLDQNTVVDFVDFALFDGCCIEVVKE